MKYQIIEVRQKHQHAGSKARDDVALFSKQAGYEPLYIKCYEVKSNTPFERVRKYLASFCSWLKVRRTVVENSCILLQNPFYNRQLGRESTLLYLKKKKKCKIISVVHDVEVLRGKKWNGDNMAHEFEFMKENSDVIVVHNEKMLAEFIKLGFEQSRLVPLGIFDYFTECKCENKQLWDSDGDVVIAGNLNPRKSPYVYKFSSLKNEVKINLYGPNFEGEDTQNITYFGSFPSDEVPDVIDGRFGLIWDGNCVETCGDETGEYLRFNNPHKTSLYLVSGLPIVIWEQAAMADFVRGNKVGITVGSLEDIKEKIAGITREEYNEMLQNVSKIRGKLLEGYYLKTALLECEKRIK